jgi:fimbrial chaperone protein
MTRCSLLWVLVSATVLGLSPTRAVAGTFSISPLRVELGAGNQTGALTLRNQEDTPVVVQAEVLLWEQVEGEDRLSPTRDLLVSPAVATIPGKGSQLLRVALRRPADPRQQLSYRLIITEVPQQASADFSGLNIALRLSLPIFVAPAAPANPQLEWSAVRDAEGRIALTARNVGNAHARVLSLSGAPASGSSPGVQQDVTAYILPGQARRWTLGNGPAADISVADWQQLRVTGSTEAGDFDVEIRLEDP